MGKRSVVNMLLELFFFYERRLIEKIKTPKQKCAFPLGAIEHRHLLGAARLQPHCVKVHSCIGTKEVGSPLRVGPVANL